ncbi:MAG TPA: hypothetical protein VLB82_07070 [Thermodesulfobacteriota bacterium]|nr:hypothetical protein [Thermodesulfobacteriota bacterium]
MGAVWRLCGRVNPILSFLALVAVLIAIVLQNKELQYSREELRRSSQALEEQSESFRVQNFENTFFQMVRLHHDIVGGIDLSELDLNKS